ncbi:Chaperonin Cpn60/TCP-1 family [Trema orientale]|uniref:1-phosphatidylinositol-3-phosphate 5-kinase n=1 Tax=Trema orientale TaxID=63057 RepID=A0A2P5FR39_TREOI|nr:Chaperonin Cpn60/TCP-1 family [Trema orientale]
MCSMCHHCGAELTKPKGSTKIRENVNSLKIDTQESILSCKFCGLKHEQKSEPGSVSHSPSVTPMISPTTSLSSSDRSASSCSEISVDTNVYDRSNQEVGLSSSQENCNFRYNGQLANLSFESSVNGQDRTHSQMRSNLKENHIGHDRYMLRDGKTTPMSNVPEEKNIGAETTNDSIDEETEDSASFEDDVDDPVWEPPEPEDPEDDLEGSVAFNDDDDDECGDGTTWGKPSSLSSCRDEGSGNYKFEEKQRALAEVSNGKFKALVSQLLKSVGISPCGQDGETWVDIVTSLSWEAASFLRSDAIVGNTMDPDGYVKVKCIATGVRSDSQLVKGLVFKKHAAHKHMPTKYKNPRLLLVQGVLGQSSSGLSSFDSMEQEKDYLKSVIEMLDLCHPNVVFVERSVSRDIQESILKKGMTLVFDMKLHRLERVARCTGSPILSLDTLTSQKLKQCDSFHIEKFVEEHASSEGGKKPSKTLMFIEGCPTRLGCTILLKGAHSDELKRVKFVVQCAVIMAYHLILETSFIVDQRAMFSTIPFAGVANVMSTEVKKVRSRDQESCNLDSESYVPCLDEGTAESELHKVEIPISGGFHDGDLYNSNIELEGNTPLYEPYNPAVLSGLSSLSASLKKVVGENFPLASSSYQSLSSYFGFNGGESNDQFTKSISASASPKALDHYDVEDKTSSDEEKLLSVEQNQSSYECSEAIQELKKDGDNDEVQSKDGVNAMLDSQSILVLMSTRNVLRGTVCEQSHFSHIMFYKNFDVPLGKFLRDNLLNQRTQCNICGELPEAHVYYYAHHKKQLTIKVHRLRTEKSLPGEAEGKIWMWSRCGKCKHGDGITESTKRVLISTPARGLSFGKFLELGFLHHSSSRRLSSCGHSLHRDFLYFFGLGPMVALFKYSPVATYAVSLPPLKLPFSNSIKHDFLRNEMENVYTKGILLFTEVANSLKEVKSQFEGLTLNLRGSFKEFSDIEDMLKQERSEFEENIRKVFSNNGNSDQAVYKLLSLNQLLWELLLESCIWDRRLHSLLSRDSVVINSSATKKAIQGQDIDGVAGEHKVDTDVILERGDLGDNIGANLNVALDASAEVDEFPIKEISIEGHVEESKSADLFNVSTVAEGIEIPIESELSPEGLSFCDSDHMPNGSNDYNSKDGQEDNGPVSDQLQVKSTISISPNTGSCDSISNLNLLKKSVSESSLLHKSENSNGWFWSPFAEIRGIEMRDLLRLYFQKFESVSNYAVENLPMVSQLISEEGRRLHIPLGIDNYIVSDYEGELSSIIACALALLKEGDIATKTLESLYSLTHVPSSRWSSNGSSDSDSVLSTPVVSLDESRFSSFDGLNLLESLVPPGTVNPVVPLGFEKSLGKSRYTVLCPYANQFRELRNWCCPSELDYIASLSRCKNWDAKGGKSKSFFAKTLDDRLIIKEIKKAEFESFMKFAEDYFRYMKESFELGNQTCLAKVLGIYQVIVRQSKSGKETRHDLMVMENLTFGRNITRQYDLKGALHARHNTTAHDPGDVLLDQNFVNDMNSSPLYVCNTAKRLLVRAVWNDTTFLNSINVMDYSLLVVVDTQRRELVCGIIDYLRQYTWDKQLETWVKSSLVPKNLLPTVISPIEYKVRFRKFMSTHFLSVPDHWCSGKSSSHCELCGVRE